MNGEPAAGAATLERRPAEPSAAPAAPPALEPAPEPARLAEALLDAGRGGKRFRPRLVRAVHELLGGTAAEAAVQVGEAVELLHTAFVVHDDVIDGDDVRRGRASTSGAFRHDAARAGASPEAAATYALAGAVLTGDLALAGAVRAMATVPAGAATVRRLLDLLDHAIRVSAAGELADVRHSLGLEDPTLAEVLAVAEHKTAVYSFQLPMQAGAVLAGAPVEVVDGLGEVGRRLGTAFQLRDDLLGVFGDPRETGKSDLGDLREGKRTPLVVHARTTATWPEVQPHLGDPGLSPADAVRVRAALEAGGSRAFVTDLAAAHVDAALVCAAGLAVPPELVGWLGELAARISTDPAVRPDRSDA
ncbi:polyprenyl synthetase family protein [Nocardioides sp. zg-DK7169]|uniref:polyprenyl synthetase family protein n=1 Tax=Nocardioides sp. zg-DK7169 TaxID=2736600 RepID=UPI001555B80D|nr:polyprenyl synthetase family protein [Nocardioides sp. zg-DK7169]NPC97915.1 polyprenyl synthetase family protein [Nocardioides sp. zg-DK7169]